MQPIKSHKYEKSLERMIDDVFLYFFKSILPNQEIYNKELVSNSQKDGLLQGEYLALSKAIKNNTIHYDGLAFVGDFNATTSGILKKLGATWDVNKKGWRISRGVLPSFLQSLVADKTNESNLRLKALQENLNNAKDLDIKPFLEDIFSKIGKNIDKEIENNLAKEKIGVYFDENDIFLQNAYKKYANETELAIKNFTEKETVELRKMVLDVIDKQGSYYELQKEIQSRFGVARRKAQFLARNETANLLVDIQEKRLDGVADDYIWDTCHCANVRPSHKKLDNTRQSFKKPPVVDEKTGRRCNPGQDYNCRCVAIPIINEDYGK